MAILDLGNAFGSVGSDTGPKAVLGVGAGGGRPSCFGGLGVVLSQVCGCDSASSI